MISNKVLLKFANHCEWFDPYFVNAKLSGIGFHALKKYSQYIITLFSDSNCSVSIRESFDQNCYYYVIQ